MKPPLSIVIPSHRRADLLALCLASVAKHAPPATQVIVVDDASPGGCIAAVAHRFGVAAIRLPKSGGFCGAANAGIRAATAEVVELLNDDTEVTAGWHAALRAFDDPGIGAVAPLVLLYDPAQGPPTHIDTAGDEYDPGGFARKRGHREPATKYQTAGPVWGVSAAAGFYRRTALLEAGGFPEFFGAYFEDVDLSFRIRKLGYAIHYEPSSVVWHRGSASYGRTPSRRTLERQSRNEELVFWRNTHGRRLWWNMPRHAAVLCGKALRRLEEGRLTPWLTGRVQGWILAANVLNNKAGRARLSCSCLQGHERIILV